MDGTAPIRAMYPRRCANCPDPILTDDLIRPVPDNPDKFVHDTCPKDKAPAPKKGAGAQPSQ